MYAIQAIFLSHELSSLNHHDFSTLLVQPQRTHSSKQCTAALDLLSPVTSHVFYFPVSSVAAIAVSMNGSTRCGSSYAFVCLRLAPTKFLSYFQVPNDVVLASSNSSLTVQCGMLLYAVGLAFVTSAPLLLFFYFFFIPIQHQTP